MDTIALDPRLKHARGFLERKTGMLIDGKFVPAASGKTFPVYNPATGTLIASVPEGDQEDVNRAVAAARRAFDERRWLKLTPSERSRIGADRDGKHHPADEGDPRGDLRPGGVRHPVRRRRP
jgi:hypothetical protein